MFFDPLGFLCPIVQEAKVIFNKICILKAGWDSKVPLEVEKNWKSFLNFLKNLNDISFDRCLFVDQNNFVSIELHWYCDASKTSYSAVIYARTIYKDKMTVKFVSGKSKVVSNKDLSIPRIELLSCLLLSKSVSAVVNALSVEVVVSKTVCWTDSLVALWWIKRADKIWKVWVGNRVIKIREKVDSSSWRHISGELNPADIATPECRPKVLTQLWFYGPEFLKSPSEKWPIFEKVPVSIPPEPGIEKLRINLTANALSMTKSNEFGIAKLIDCNRFSNLKKLLIVSALVLRFVLNMKCVLTGRERSGGEVQLLEVRNSE